MCTYHNMISGLVLIFIGCVIVLILCILGVIGKNVISNVYLSRFVSLLWIIGGLLFVTQIFDFQDWWTSYRAYSLRRSNGTEWIMFLGVMVHGYDVMSL